MINLTSILLNLRLLPSSPLDEGLLYGCHMLFRLHLFPLLLEDAVIGGLLQFLADGGEQLAVHTSNNGIKFKLDMIGNRRE